ncbi:hypothetical protein J2S11_002042 [Bacillus horti]|uniref:Uncharacterized protein n=1 Tax=Caldalkalibacillus horti TaxID=77523 RepID=A0ABT9VYT3_9BACI|nr:hypothetical protein [Bacillus horti]
MVVLQVVVKKLKNVQLKMKLRKYTPLFNSQRGF